LVSFSLIHLFYVHIIHTHPVVEILSPLFHFFFHPVSINCSYSFSAEASVPPLSLVISTVSPYYSFKCSQYVILQTYVTYCRYLYTMHYIPGTV
jgi:hypothetical protein